MHCGAYHCGEFQLSHLNSNVSPFFVCVAFVGHPDIHQLSPFNTRQNDEKQYLHDLLFVCVQQCKV